MTDRNSRRNGHEDDEQPRTIVVPGTARRAGDLPDDELIIEEQQVRDLGSASRSCTAIIAILLVMALLVCVFLVWAFFLR